MTLDLDARKSFDEPWSRGLRMLALAAGLLLAAAACGEPREGGEPVESAAPDTESGARATSPGAVLSALPPLDAGAASPTVEERIYDSDVVVRASLQSAEPGKLRFRAIEYLKGTGPADFVVNADTSGRDTKWDKLEAVLFLSRAPAEPGAAAAGPEFVFTEAHYKKPPGYTIDTLDPAWLPAQATPSGASGASAGAAVFVTDSGVATGGSTETISLADLRSKIAWVSGGDDVRDAAAYDLCVRSVFGWVQFYRDHEAYYGRPFTPAQFEKQLASGTATGTLVADYGAVRTAGYDTVWLTGADAALFRTRLIDNDGLAYNGYSQDTRTVRPLPGGVYTFSSHVQGYEYTPCNFKPEGGTGQAGWTITVVKPAGTVHEAFFDPVAIGSDVGADGSNGVLKPNAFGHNSATTTIGSIRWGRQQVTVTSSQAALPANHHVDFIALDGTVALRLDVDDATQTTSGSVRTLTWGVCARPWSAGDKLMLRLSLSPANLTGATNDASCAAAPPS